MTADPKDETAFGLSVSRETMTRLEVFVAMLTKWNSAINLVSKSTLDDVWFRHVADSVQVFQHGSNARNWVDLGSGGGFPGAVVAILAAELAPDMKVTMVESDQRKAAFLRQSAQTLGLPTHIIASRIEAIDPMGADVVSARALAPLPQLCAFSKHHLAQNGTAIFLKGKGAAAEIAQARVDWSFDLESFPSTTDPSSVVLVLREINHV